MKKGLSEIICIIDRSGSMSRIKEDAIGGFNQFLNDQKEVPGEAKFTYVQFNDDYNKVLDCEDINNVNEIDGSTYRPEGLTALYDAVGKTINDVGKRLSETDENEKPEKIIVAILTDGLENNSKEFLSPDVIKDMINHQKEKYNWEFIFLAANQDAFETGSTLGISSKDTYNFDATGEGVQTAYRSMSESITSYRS